MDGRPIALLIDIVHGNSVDVGLIQIALAAVELVCSATAGDAGSEIEECGWIARLVAHDQRQSLIGLNLHGAAQCSVRYIQSGRSRIDRDGKSAGSNGQAYIQTKGLQCIEGNILLGVGLKSLCAHCDRIKSGIQGGRWKRTPCWRLLFHARSSFSSLRS